MNQKQFSEALGVAGRGTMIQGLYEAQQGRHKTEKHLYKVRTIISNCRAGKVCDHVDVMIPRTVKILADR